MAQGLNFPLAIYAYSIKTKDLSYVFAEHRQPTNMGTSHIYVRQLSSVTGESNHFFTNNVHIDGETMKNILK